MSTENRKNCCNCKHNIRTGEIGYRECHCEIDGHYINYKACFEDWCKYWSKDRNENNKKLRGKK